MLRKLSWNFPKIISPKMDIPGIYSPGIFHSWNLFLSWNFLFLESYFTEFTCYLNQSLHKNKLFSLIWHGKGCKYVLSDMKRPVFYVEISIILQKQTLFTHLAWERPQICTLLFQLEDMFQLIVTPQGIEKVIIQLKDTPTKVYALCNMC